MNSTLYTIGHSNHETASFISLLRDHGITAIVDVRSHPFSRHVPQYSLKSLKNTLSDIGISYVFLGKELGARSDNPDDYKQGKVQFDRLAASLNFSEGIKRVIIRMKRYRIALMCAEKDPLNCHRALLVARKFFESGIPVKHIHVNGSLETHEELESRLLALGKLPEGNMFKSRAECMTEAYVRQGERIAYYNRTMEHTDQVAVR